MVGKCYKIITFQETRVVSQKQAHVFVHGKLPYIFFLGGGGIWKTI